MAEATVLSAYRVPEVLFTVRIEVFDETLEGGLYQVRVIIYHDVPFLIRKSTVEEFHAGKELDKAISTVLTHAR